MSALNVGSYVLVPKGTVVAACRDGRKFTNEPLIDDLVVIVTLVGVKLTSVGRIPYVSWDYQNGTTAEINKLKELQDGDPRIKNVV
jgi:hypothetical protein